MSADDASCLRALVREADPSQAERAFSWAKRCPDPTKDRAGAVAAVMALADEDFDVHCHVQDLCYRCECSAPLPPPAPLLSIARVRES